MLRSHGQMANEADRQVTRAHGLGTDHGGTKGPGLL